MADPTASPPARLDRYSTAYAEALVSSLKWDAERTEPYLQLPSFPNLRCTPFRDGIEDDLVELFNIHIIGKRLYVLPYPMHRPFAEDWVKREKAAHAKLCDDIVATVGSTTPPADGTALAPGGFRPTRGHGVRGFPFQTLVDTTTGRVVGEIGLHPQLEPNLYREYKDTAPTEEQFLALPPGARVWMVGYVLHPDYHGRGIMTEMLDCAIEFARTFMEAGFISAYVEYNNAASTATVRKARFSWVRDQLTPWPVEKGGGTHYSGLYVWDLCPESVDVGDWGVGRVTPPDGWEQLMNEHKEKALALEEAARRENEEGAAAAGESE